MHPRFSIVVSAPGGLDACRYLDNFWIDAGDRCAELVVVDGSKPFADRSRDGLRHIEADDADIQSLIAAGLRAAQGEWIIVTEDHCQPLPGFFAAYDQALSDHPEVDLFAGAAVNRTSTSPWSQAVFLTGLGGQWAGRGTPMTEPSNANMMVRRSALVAEEIGLDGGLLNLAVPRLSGRGRFAPCPDAVVDHVLPLSARQAIAFQFRCAAGCHDTSVAARSAAEAAEVKSRNRLKTALRIFALEPFRIAGRLPEPALARAAMALRLTVLGLTVISAILTVRLLRAFGRTPRRANAHSRLAQ